MKSRADFSKPKGKEKKNFAQKAKRNRPMTQKRKLSVKSVDIKLSLEKKLSTNILPFVTKSSDCLLTREITKSVNVPKVCVYANSKL